ncbi:MAG: hypothetical protein Q9180_008886 [Flavoplaca navasiana]
MATKEDGEDVEIHLQRVCTKVIDELRVSIPLFLYRKEFGRNGIRKFVKSSNTAKIERLRTRSAPFKNGLSFSIPP